MTHQWGWAGTVAEFFAADDVSILHHLEQHQIASMGDRPSSSQITAWTDEIRAVRNAISEVAREVASAWSWGVVFEYELPREGGRRPDVVILAGDSVIVLEFKGSPILARAHLDQVDAYARDLSEYHSESHDRTVAPVLVLVDGDESGEHYGVSVTNANHLARTIKSLTNDVCCSGQIDLGRWLAGEYAPLPSLVRAARTIFSHEPLPQIRRAESSGVDEAVDYLRGIAAAASRDGGMHLAIVAGVPGAGKTLVGLRFVYETHFESDGSPDAVFLSGNGPLVQVLQHTLSKEGHEGRAFVRDVHAFLKSYGGSSTRHPYEHMWVYDEAQRAWDEEKVKEKRPTGFSEPEDFLRVGEKLGDWALMVGLIGEGQEIHVGEESGLQQWNDALGDVDRPWVVHCPPRVGELFSAAHELRTNESLDLSVTLRSHKADQLHDWVGALLDDEFSEARRLAAELKQVAFSPLVTRDPNAAKTYARARYADAPEARFGLMMSSQRKWAAPFGFVDDFYLKPGPWFGDDESSPFSCRRMERAVTEFQCQGLELDLPIIGWGGDLMRAVGAWNVPSGVRKRLQHPDRITRNVYRVLLTRGRDGFVVVVPPRMDLDDVFGALVEAGCDVLEEVRL